MDRRSSRFPITGQPRGPGYNGFCFRVKAPIKRERAIAKAINCIVGGRYSMEAEVEQFGWRTDVIGWHDKWPEVVTLKETLCYPNNER